MVDPRWELKIGSMVTTTDGEYGRLQQLLVNPHWERIIALLIQPYRLIPPPIVVVPEELIADASVNEVRLEISRELVDELPRFWPESELTVEDQIYGADDEVIAVSGKGGVEVKQAPNSKEPNVIESLLFGPESEHLGLQVCASQQVFCRDGYAGHVSMILSDAKGRIKGFVLHTGHLHLIGRELIVPAKWLQEVDRGSVHLSVYKSDLESLPIYSPDAKLSEKVDDALWSDEILRNTDYEEIGVSVQDGIAILRGHVLSAMNKKRVENAARSVVGVLGVENDLVVDQDLVIDVAQALGTDESTRFERISVGAEYGIITLNGRVSSAAIRDAAEAIAASIPQVRGVINYLQAPNLVSDPKKQQFWLPPIGHEVSAADMLLGQVEKVIINPRNRCVTTFVVHGYLPDLRTRNDYRPANENRRQERRVMIPVEAVFYATHDSLLLMESGVETALHHDFDPAEFISPPADWQPPYPYLWEEVLFEKERTAEPKCEDA
jgi:osmotically-inducible protein OsmY/sporulation protein YlmC with PRC-barrel domain